MMHSGARLKLKFQIQTLLKSIGLHVLLLFDLSLQQFYNELLKY